MKDYYSILEVSPRARQGVIDAAYKSLAKVLHPDKIGKNGPMKELNEAFDVLGDKTKRKKYDKDRVDIKGKTVGDYRVLDLIAEGGFGRTYKGEHTTLGTPVCIKHALNVSPQDEFVLTEEAKAVWDLRHYAIPAMRTIVKLDDGSLALIMSYVPGQTIEEIVTQKGKGLKPEHVCWMTERILNALKYLHWNGVVHGDVKPQNIIVQPDSHQLVLVDYGLSLIKPSRDAKNKGYTPHFAPPEQVANRPLLPESDFYAMGMTMIYALGGDIAKKQVPDHTPDEVCKFIKRLIVRDVMSRPRWDNEDLVETIKDIRIKSFGRASTFGEDL